MPQAMQPDHDSKRDPSAHVRLTHAIPSQPSPEGHGGVGLLRVGMSCDRLLLGGAGNGGSGGRIGAVSSTDRRRSTSTAGASLTSGSASAS
jgi:hypothetical protein